MEGWGEEVTFDKVVRGRPFIQKMRTKTAMRRVGERVSMSHDPGGALPGQAGYVCSLAKGRWAAILMQEVLVHGALSIPLCSQPTLPCPIDFQIRVGVSFSYSRV